MRPLLIIRMPVNQECIHGVRPWVITSEHGIWLTKAKNGDTVYAIVKQQPRWPNPIVLKITNVTPKLIPPHVETGAATFDASNTATLQGNLLDMGKTGSGFRLPQVSPGWMPATGRFHGRGFLRPP